MNETRTFSSETNVGSPDPERPCFSVFEASFFFFLRFRVNRVQRFAVSYSVVLLFQGKKYQENIVSTKSREKKLGDARFDQREKLRVIQNLIPSISLGSPASF